MVLLYQCIHGLEHVVVCSTTVVRSFEDDASVSVSPLLKDDLRGVLLPLLTHTGFVGQPEQRQHSARPHRRRPEGLRRGMETNPQHVHVALSVLFCITFLLLYVCRFRRRFCVS